MDKIKGAVGPPRSQVVATASASFASNAPPSVKKSYQLCISCSPDKVPTMKTLQRDLQAAGIIDIQPTGLEIYSYSTLQVLQRTLLCILF